MFLGDVHTLTLTKAYIRRRNPFPEQQIFPACWQWYRSQGTVTLGKPNSLYPTIFDSSLGQPAGDQPVQSPAVAPLTGSTGPKPPQACRRIASASCKYQPIRLQNVGWQGVFLRGPAVPVCSVQRALGATYPSRRSCPSSGLCNSPPEPGNQSKDSGIVANALGGRLRRNNAHGLRYVV